MHIIYVAFMLPSIDACMEAHLGVSCAVHACVQLSIFHACLVLPKETTCYIHKTLFAHKLIPGNTGSFHEKLINTLNIKVLTNLIE